MPLRTCARYFLLPPLPATFGCETARVFDLSLKGARVELGHSIPAGSRLPLTIETAGSPLRTETSVLWCQIDDLSLEDDNDRYLAGIVFDDLAAQSVGELIDRLLATHTAVPIEDCRSAERYRLNAPLTAHFGIAPAAIIDVSIRGARISIPHFIPPGTSQTVRFQVDQTSGVIRAAATVVWCLGSEGEGFEAGLKIDGVEERLRASIHRLCMRDEARIDLHSLKRKFDALRRGAREGTVHATS